MSPSNPVSVGIIPSFRALEAGVKQENVPPAKLVKSEQSAVRDDPFIDSTGPVWKNMNSDGSTSAGNKRNSLPL